MLKNIFILNCIFGLVLIPNNITAQQPQGKKYFDEALEYFKKGDWENAVIACRKTIEIDPNYVEAYFGMGRAYTILGKPKDAIDAFEKAISIDPNHANSYLGLGVLYSNIGEYQKGTTALRKALDIEPNNFVAYVALANIHYEKLTQFKEALSLLEKAKSINADYADVYIAFGDVYRCLNQIEKAKENYKKGISLYRSQGFEKFVEEYEKKLNNIEDSYVEVYLNPEKRTIVRGIITEDAETYLRVKGDITAFVGGDGVIQGLGGEQKVNKADIHHIKLFP